MSLIFSKLGQKKKSFSFCHPTIPCMQTLASLFVHTLSRTVLRFFSPSLSLACHFCACHYPVSPCQSIISGCFLFNPSFFLYSVFYVFLFSFCIFPLPLSFLFEVQIRDPGLLDRLPPTLPNKLTTLALPFESSFSCLNIWWLLSLLA